MALIRVGADYVAAVYGKHLAAYSIRSEKVIECSVPVPSDTASKSRDKDSNSFIVAAEFDASAKFFAACTDCKQLLVWDVEKEWKLHSSRLLPRRPTALAFTKCGSYVIVADKAGDVHRFSVSGDSDASDPHTFSNSLLLGHVSMLMDLKLSAEDRYLVTCDRDEKIRVSCYPNAYNIHSYCLGHTEYVTRLCYFPADDLLASSSGDGTLKLWNYKCGEILDSVDCSAYVESASDNAGADVHSNSHDRSKDIRCMACCHRLLAVSFNGRSDLLLFSVVSRNRLVFHHHLSLSAFIWDVAFLTDRHLLVLQASESPTAVVCTLSVSDSSSVMMLLSTDDEDVRSLVERINCNTELFRSVGVPSIFPVLHKARIDNMKDYIEKKRLRLAAEKQKEQKDEKTSTDVDTDRVLPT